MCIENAFIKTNKTIKRQKTERMMSLKIFKSTRVPIAREDKPEAFSATLSGVDGANLSSSHVRSVQKRGNRDGFPLMIWIVRTITC
jgi:hypothetical protein